MREEDTVITQPGDRSEQALLEPHTGLSARALETIDRKADLGADFKMLREHAMLKLLTNPFITPAHEMWRYTKPELFKFKEAINAAAVDFQLRDYLTGDKIQAADGLEMAKGIGITPLLLEELLKERAQDLEEDVVTSLQLACTSSVCTLKVTGSYNSDKPVQILQKVGEGLSACPLLIVMVEKGASVTLVEDLDFSSELFYFPRVEVLLGQGANCNFVSLQRLGPASTYLARHRFHLLRDSSLNSFHLCLGGKTARLDLDCKLYQEGASADLHSLYLVDKRRHADIHTTQMHLAPNCRSDLYCKGVLKDQARSVYYGFIKVAEGAQKTDAYQTNRNLVLSHEARADTIPNLEIKANDVKCSHGASVGQVSQDELFYLMTRGLSRDRAERLLVEGFFEDLLSRLKDQALHDLVSQMILKRLYA